MWKANLNVETDIVIAEPSELGDIRAKGNFDLIRRGVVFPTNSEIASLSSIFGSFGAVENVTAPIAQPSPTSPPANVPNVSGTNVEKSIAPPVVVSEAQALFELRAIPLYFPITFALVKPYVDGFETNNFDIQSPTSLSINQDWRPKQQ